MARDSGLEEAVREYLDDFPGLSGKAMFGSWCWLLDGSLVCCASQAGVMVRLGKGNEAWALDVDGITPFTNGQRPMPGWVLVSPEAFADDNLASKLIEGARSFVQGLPPK